MRAILSLLAFGLVFQPAHVAAQEIMEVGNMDPTCRNFYPGASPRGEEMKKVTFVNTRA